MWSVINDFLKNFKKTMKVVTILYKLIKEQLDIFIYYLLGYSELLEKPILRDEERLDIEVKRFSTINRYIVVESYEQLYFIMDKKYYKTIDFIELYIQSFFYNTNNFYSRKLPRYFYRNKHYYCKISSEQNYFSITKTTKINLFKGILSIWTHIRLWVFSFLLLSISIYFLSFIRVLPVNTVLFQWFAIAMFSYWLISGFVFFIKKYRFGKFTAAIQRFWRRSYILFWLIESCLLIVFVYLTLNATQETSYMLDHINVFKNHLFSWRAFLPKLFLNTLLVIFSYLLLLNIKWNIFKKNISFILFITITLTYMLWLEFYQIYHVGNFYSNLFWSYDVDERVWALESDVRRTRIVNHYVMILFLLKFWHIVFIYVFWIFFVLRASELERIRYPIYSANFQNFIILYIMSWIFMYPWLKVISQKYLSTPYFWFYINNRKLGFRIFFYDLKLVVYSIHNFSINNLYKFNNSNYFYWTLPNFNNNYETFRKHTIKDVIVKKLYTQ